MTDETNPQVRSFNPQAMLDNIAATRQMIQRIRQKDGGIGSEQDELCLHRVIQDLDILVDMVEALKVSHVTLQQQAKTGIETLQGQMESLKVKYEEMLEARNKRIKDLEGETPPEET